MDQTETAANKQTLLLRFYVSLEPEGPADPQRPHGPLFHRWLPDGEKDALTLETTDPNALLKIWFRRRGFVRNEFIVYSENLFAVSPELMVRQSVLDAGPLGGQLELGQISDEAIVSVRETRRGSQPYEELGKRIVKNILDPVMSRVVNTLRTNYGQHWLRPFESWDSRQESLGSRCYDTYHLEWSLDGGQNWQFLVPTEVTQRFAGTGGKYRDYLREEDWPEIEAVLNAGYAPSLGALVLGRAHRLFDVGDLRYAFIEGVSALEITLGEYLQAHLPKSKQLRGAVQNFWQLPLAAQTVALLGLLGKTTDQDLEGTLNAINVRNHIVHEGMQPQDTERSDLAALLRVTAQLHAGPDFRFASQNAPRVSASAESWATAPERPEPIIMEVRYDPPHAFPSHSGTTTGESQ